MREHPRRRPLFISECIVLLGVFSEEEEVFVIIKMIKKSTSELLMLTVVLVRTLSEQQHTTKEYSQSINQ